MGTSIKSKNTDLPINSNPSDLKIPFPDNKRIDLMQTGAADLINWLNDQIKNGLASLPTYGMDFWETISKRMVDSKLSGLSNRIWNIFNFIENEEDWEELVLNELSELSLLANALLDLSKFSKEEQLDFLNVSGFNITKKHLEKSNLISDDWKILAVQASIDSRMKSRRTWIQGAKTKFMGLLLEYAWGKQDFMINWIPGKQFRGDLKIYPSLYPLRLMVVNYVHLESEFKTFAAYPDLGSFLTAYSNAIALKPVIHKFPLCLKEVKIQAKDEKIFIIDNENKSLECKCEDSLKWGLLAISAGHPLRLFATWDGSKLEPQSVMMNNRFISLSDQ